MGMRIAGRILLERIARDDLVVEMRSWGIAARRAHEIVDTTLEALRAGTDHANRLFPQAGARHAHPTLARIERLARD